MVIHITHAQPGVEGRTACPHVRPTIQPVALSHVLVQGQEEKGRKRPNLNSSNPCPVGNLISGKIRRVATC
ncbi:hypothetical protein RRG08_054227 [Elysia crispata]|uniref:Uncharacterized protein n=1 Tax=Elysia crispata TaxID=231223 RepID=A0AAE1CWK7_9GAST|nr:hypothetical protein RRG08_054227 [Elysia crispata]